jgi:LSD1 subclass zinc finger protein
VDRKTLKSGACHGCRNVEQKFKLNFLEGASRVMLTIQLNLILKVHLRWLLFREYKTKEYAL